MASNVGQVITPSGAITTNLAAAMNSPKDVVSGNVSSTEPTAPRAPRRFYGSIELDIVRPVNSFDAILNAVVMDLQRTQGAKVKLTLEIDHWWLGHIRHGNDVRKRKCVLRKRKINALLCRQAKTKFFREASWFSAFQEIFLNPRFA